MSTATKHLRQIEVGWGDCDPAGIVFYPNFYRWFDACSHALLTARGLSHRDPQRTLRHYRLRPDRHRCPFHRTGAV